MAQLGRAVLVRAETAPGSGVWKDVCALTAKTLSINNASISTTAPDCDNPSGVLHQTSLNGVQSMSISGDGIFDDTEGQNIIIASANGSDPYVNFQFYVDNLGTYEGKFLIESLELSGGSEEVLTFSISLSSSGAVVFTPAGGAGLVRPGAVRNLAATSTVSGRVDLDWDAPAAGSTPIFYRIERAEVAALPGGAPVVGDFTGGSNQVTLASRLIATELKNPGTRIGAHYIYRVRSENAAGISAYAYVKITST